MAKYNIIHIIFGVGILVLLFLANRHCTLKCTKREGYGQDASIRMTAGGVAGTGMYGYDPVMQFAEQLQTMRTQDAMMRAAGPPLVEGFCDPRPSYWDVNFYPRNFEYPSYPPNDLVYTNGPFASPDGNIGPSCGTM